MTPHPTSIVAPWALRRGAPVRVTLGPGAVVAGVMLDGGRVAVRDGGLSDIYEIGTSEFDDVTPDAVALDCLDPLGRLCLRMALAKGEPCPHCDGRGSWPMAEDDSEVLIIGIRPSLGAMMTCADCEGRSGWLRAPVAAHWIGTEAEGGSLTQAHADAAGMSLDELAASLLVRCAGMTVVGLREAWRTDATFTEVRPPRSGEKPR